MHSPARLFKGNMLQKAADRKKKKLYILATHANGRMEALSCVENCGYGDDGKIITVWSHLAC